MTQKTTRSVVEGLLWLVQNPHHEAGIEDGGYHRYYKNYQDKLRIPATVIWGKYIEPNTRPFDTRMFRPNRKGMNLLKRNGWIVNFSAGKVTKFYDIESRT